MFNNTLAKPSEETNNAKRYVFHVLQTTTATTSHKNKTHIEERKCKQQRRCAKKKLSRFVFMKKKLIIIKYVSESKRKN
jgi:hypothetical protein